MDSLLKNIGFFLAIATLSCLDAQAQACGSWQNVGSWLANFTITGSASGVVVDPFTWNINHQGSVTATLNPSTTPCTWLNGPSSGTGLVNDQGTLSCSPSGNYTIKFDGSQFVEGAAQVTIDSTNNTYTFYPSYIVSGTDTIDQCGSTSGGAAEFFGGPYNSCSPTLGGVTFTLPAKVGPLQQSSVNFSELAICPYGVPTNWNVTFTLTPSSATDNNNVDDQCNKNGGSSIGCQNRSLGEDVPIVGTGFSLHYEGDRAPGRMGANPAATADAAMIGGWTLNVHHAYDPNTNTLFQGDGGQRSAWQLGSPVTYKGNTLLTSKDGSEIYVFNPSGQHLQTLKPLTGALKYKFAYNSAGNLSSITDASGNVTKIKRNGSQHPTAIVSPFSQTTILSVDSNNFLSQVTDPAGSTVGFVNNSAGLITSRTDPNGNVYSYNYDSQGRLTEDSDPVGGSTSLNTTSSQSGYSVVTTTALGRSSTFQVNTGVIGEELTNTWPDGLVRTYSNTQSGGQLFQSRTLPDGSASSATMGPDPRWGLQTPVPLSGTVTEGKLTMATTGSRTASMGSTGDPFSLTTQIDTTTVNGRTSTSIFTSTDLTYVNTSPAKRKTTAVLDSLERISSTQIGSLLPLKFAYDSHGRLSTTTQGTRVTTMAYDANGFLINITNPLKQTTSFTHDAAGRVITKTLPDGRVISYTYDNNGNLTSVTPPGKSAHDFSFTAVNLMATYTPPTAARTGATTYAYDTDRDLTTITRPDGKMITYAYDGAGRLSSTTTPTESISYSYKHSTGDLSRAAVSGGEAIAYGFNGPLLTSSTWTGTVAGSVSRTYNDNFWVASQSINGGNKVTFTYDNDGLLTKAGSLTLKVNSNALTVATTLGSATDSRSYNAFGELTGYTANYGGSTLYMATLTRDASGRISGKRATIGGVTNTFKYSYDAAGRLTAVKENGSTVSSYDYDTNSNRIQATTSSGTVKGKYDAEDRLLSYGSTSYTYTANGELASQTVGSQTTTYTYDVLGNVIAATLPNGKKITYIVDANNHRVGKAVNGSLTTGFLYDGDRIVAQLNGSNAIVSQFVYASQTQTPDYMVSGGVIYRIFSDQLGSPRLVLNTTNGAIAEQIDNDEFGNVISDTNPGFQPFGFAGGLYDQDTKLVRFGARDYNPAVGRWTAKDPILFAGGDTNLYGYVLNDPVNSWDASGLAPGWVNDILNWFQNLNQPMQFGNGVDDVQQSAQQFLDNLVQDGAEVPTNVTSTGCKTSFGPGGYGGWGGGLGTALLFVNTGLLQQLLQQGAPWQACPNHNCAL